MGQLDYNTCAFGGNRTEYNGKFINKVLNKVSSHLTSILWYASTYPPLLSASFSHSLSNLLLAILCTK